MSKKQWFGVKSIYLLEASGKPKAKDATFKTDTKMVEERIILVEASTLNQALKLGLKEAKNYAKASFTNPYDQKVTVNVLGLDAFPIANKLGDFCEVFSSTDLLHGKQSRKQILDHRLGANPVKNDEKLRRKFADASLEPEVVRRTTESIKN